MGFIYSAIFLISFAEGDTVVDTSAVDVVKKAETGRKKFVLLEATYLMPNGFDATTATLISFDIGMGYNLDSEGNKVVYVKIGYGNRGNPPESGPMATLGFQIVKNRPYFYGLYASLFTTRGDGHSMSGYFAGVSMNARYILFDRLGFTYGAGVHYGSETRTYLDAEGNTQVESRSGFGFIGTIGMFWLF